VKSSLAVEFSAYVIFKDQEKERVTTHQTLMQEQAIKTAPIRRRRGRRKKFGYRLPQVELHSCLSPLAYRISTYQSILIPSSSHGNQLFALRLNAPLQILLRYAIHWLMTCVDSLQLPGNTDDLC